MPSSVILRRVALVRTDVSEELRASIIRATRIGELETTLAVNANYNIQGIAWRFLQLYVLCKEYQSRLNFVHKRTGERCRYHAVGDPI
jgi:hypothetical protein